MKSKRHFILFFSFIFLISICGNAQNSTGKLLLAKGQKIQINNETQSVISQEMMGQVIEITIDANMIHLLEVKDKKPHSYLIASTLTKLSTNGTAMGQAMKFDSDKKEDMETETGKLMKGQLNVTKEVELNEMAQVINVVKKSVASPSGGQLMDMINNLTGGNADETNGAAIAFEIIPTGKKIGDSWSDSSVNGDIKTYSYYTLKSINGNNAIILLTGKQMISKKMEQQGMEINVKMVANLSGEGIVDMNTGLLQQRTTVMNGTGSAELMGQSIPMTSKITTTTSVKKI
jgi:hypothetical protein